MSVVKKLFDIKELRDKFTNNDDDMFRLIFGLISYNKDEYVLILIMK